MSARVAAAARGETGAGHRLADGRQSAPSQACSQAGPGGTGRGASCLVTAAASPYHARALTTPTRPATATAVGAGRRAIATAAADSTMKLASSQPTARAGGRVRHQDPSRPPCESGIMISSMTGNAARYGQENGSSETPNSRPTTGERSTLAVTVYHMQRPNAAPPHPLATPS